MRKSVRRNENKREDIIMHCHECANSYDWHHPAVDGHLTLARCPYKHSSVLLKDPQCDHFKIRKNADTEEQVRT